MRRAFTILAVMLVVTIGALVASSAMYAADAQHSLVEASIRRTRSRALAWSGVQAAMAELAAQRDDLLDGAEPRLTEQWDLFDLGDGRRGAVRLIPVDASGAIVVSEAGKLNVNTVTQEMLALLPGVDEALAERIVGRREAGPIASVESLADLEGMTTSLLYGEIGAEEALLGESGIALIQLLTAFSADPNVQSGVGAPSSSYRGDRKLNINGPWSDRLGDAIARRYDEDMADGVKQVMESEFDLSAESQFVAFMRQIGSPPEDWVEPLDVFTATPDPYTPGRIDLLTAPVEVLAAVPGLDESTAEAIVQARHSLDDESRRTLVWPVIEGVMTEQQFQEAVDHLASRSMQWRVRVEVGVLREEQAADVSPSDDRGPMRTDMIGGSFAGADARIDLAPLEDRLVLDAVIDVASMRPRVAYLRDVTHLDLAFRLVSMLPEALVDEGESIDEPALGDEPPPADEPTDMAPDAMVGDEEMSVGDARNFSPFEDDGEPAPTVESFDEGEDRRVGRWQVGGDT